MSQEYKSVAPQTMYVTSSNNGVAHIYSGFDPSTDVSPLKYTLYKLNPATMNIVPGSEWTGSSHLHPWALYVSYGNSGTPAPGNIFGVFFDKAGSHLYRTYSKDVAPDVAPHAVNGISDNQGNTIALYADNSDGTLHKLDTHSLKTIWATYNLGAINKIFALGADTDQYIHLFVMMYTMFGGQIGLKWADDTFQSVQGPSVWHQASVKDGLPLGANALYVTSDLEKKPHALYVATEQGLVMTQLG